MLSKYIKTPDDLVTRHEDVRQGFLVQAITKGKISDNFIERAKELNAALANINKVDDVLSLSKFGKEIMAAAGFSEKAQNHLSPKEIQELIKKVLNRILEKENSSFGDEIVYRYLLTKGDALGGSMRNIIGSLAGEKFTTILLKILKIKKFNPQITKNKSGKIQSIIWNNRTLLFDVKPRLIGKNIDVILINRGDVNTSEEELLADKTRYIACGELKGGIDPAGADEHWKTANSALGRIRTTFGRKTPALFFVGAAIETTMAEEIFKQLKSGKLSYAANLNNKEQVNDLVDWLLSL